MIGSIYANYPETLINQMTDLGFKKRLPGLIRPLVSLYLKVFGVPEIGFQIRALALKRDLRGLKPKFVLDAGCGLGVQADYLKKRFPAAEVDAFDLDAAKIQICQKVCHPKINFFPADITSLTLKRRYDLIVCVDVLEHLPDWKKALLILSKFLDKDGKIYLHVPLNGQRRHFHCFLSWEHDTHKSQGLEESDLHKWLKEHNYEIVLTKGDHRFFGSLAWELNMIFMNNLLLGALFYPLFLPLIYLDGIFGGRKYNCLSLVFQKRKD